MPETVALVSGGITALLVLWLVKRIRRNKSDQRRSRERHTAAQQREPPVDIGDVRTAAVEEFTTHHSGERHAVCKIEGFVVFAHDVPTDLEVTDVVRIKILSFNRGQTSATATVLERA